MPYNRNARVPSRGGRLLVTRPSHAGPPPENLATLHYNLKNNVVLHIDLELCLCSVSGTEKFFPQIFFLSAELT